MLITFKERKKSFSKWTQQLKFKSGTKLIAFLLFVNDFQKRTNLSILQSAMVKVGETGLFSLHTANQSRRRKIEFKTVVLYLKTDPVSYLACGRGVREIQSYKQFFLVLEIILV